MLKQYFDFGKIWDLLHYMCTLIWWHFVLIQKRRPFMPSSYLVKYQDILLQ